MRDLPAAIVQAVQQLAARRGVEIRRKRPSNHGTVRLVGLLDRLGIRTVFDVGANTGQYAQDLFDHGYPGRIVSFEPLPDEWTTLSERARTDPRWVVADRCALGDARGRAQLHVAGNSQSSSLLAMESLHATTAPESRFVRDIEVEVHRFDELAPRFGDTAHPYCLKLDVQGFEAQVLAGAGAALDMAAVIVREMSMVPMYEGERVLELAVGDMRAMGFTPWSIDPVFVDRATGRQLQVEGCFVRDTCLARLGPTAG